MSVRAPVGPVNLATQRICIGRGLAAIRPFPSRLQTLYTFYLLRSIEASIAGNRLSDSIREILVVKQC